MKRFLFSAMSLAFSLSLSSQIVRQNEEFEVVSIIEDKVAFVKEVQVDQNLSENNYNILKEWARENYGKDPFISSVRYDNKEKGLIAKSRVELILPPNSQGVREKVIMRFRINSFLAADKCVLEILDLSYLHENARDKKLPRVIRAEELITNRKIEIEDDLKEFRANTRKSTLYFLNTLGKEFEALFGY